MSTSGASYRSYRGDQLRHIGRLVLWRVVPDAAVRDGSRRFRRADYKMLHLLRRTVDQVKTMWVIRNDRVCPLGVVGQAFDAAGVDWRYVEAWDGAGLPDVADIGGLVVLGGEMNVDEVAQYPFLADVRSLVREATDAERPVLGICLGAQILARAFDATVHHQVAREIGFHKVFVTEAGEVDPVVSAFSPASMLFQFHEDHCELPAQAQLLASSDAVAAQAFRIGRSYGMQFHFEVTLAEITAWVDDTKPGELEDVWGTTRSAILAGAALHLEAQQDAGRRAAGAFAAMVLGSS